MPLSGAENEGKMEQKRSRMEMEASNVDLWSSNPSCVINICYPFNCSGLPFHSCHWIGASLVYCNFIRNDARFQLVTQMTSHSWQYFFAIWSNRVSMMAKRNINAMMLFLRIGNVIIIHWFDFIEVHFYTYEKLAWKIWASIVELHFNWCSKSGFLNRKCDMRLLYKWNSTIKKVESFILEIFNSRFRTFLRYFSWTAWTGLWQTVLQICTNMYFAKLFTMSWWRAHRFTHILALLRMPIVDNGYSFTRSALQRFPFTCGSVSCYFAAEKESTSCHMHTQKEYNESDDAARNAKK